MNEIDFTIERYKALLKSAKLNYNFVSYDDIPWNKKFVLWRHDCDFSLNRAHVIAKIEASENLTSTYFINPHSEYYNIFENTQFKLIKDIIRMGHRIGLHFDASFYNIMSTEDLNNNIGQEASLLQELFNTVPIAFSFHNPIEETLNCEDYMLWRVN